MARGKKSKSSTAAAAAAAPVVDDSASTTSEEVRDEEDDCVEKDDDESSSKNSDDGSSSGSDDDGDDDDEDGSDDDNESSEGDDEDMADAEEDTADVDAAPASGAAAQPSEEGSTFDLRNLMAFNTHQVDSSALFDTAKNNNPDYDYIDQCTISGSIKTSKNSLSLPAVANESFLMNKASEGVSQLLRELWNLPKEKSDVGPISSLPGYCTLATPRALPPPPPKKDTKWESFAKERGIAPKNKRSRKVFDEVSGDWTHLTGRDAKPSAASGGAGPESWPIAEVKKNDDPFEDPWERMREERKNKGRKNTENRMRNAERSGELEKGATYRQMKDWKKADSRVSDQRLKEKQQRQEGQRVLPSGVPVDMKSSESNPAKRGKASTKEALRLAQSSTASLGKFDELRHGEPERKNRSIATITSKKRKFDGGSTDRRVVDNEAAKSSEILKRVVNGGGLSKEKDRAIRKGKFAGGETAYDYEFDDSASGSGFKRKKGRAAAGKMKKMTKKRIV